MRDIFEKVREIIADSADLEAESILPEKSLMNDLDLTSMDIMTMIADFEKAFGIRIPEKVLRTFVTVQDVMDCIAAKLEEKG